jgi:membrane protein implicated in regulation of membrane protease activity
VRHRLPLLAGVLLMIVCLLLLGFVCACFGDEAIQAIDRALSVGPALAPVIEVWTLALAASLTMLLLARAGRFGTRPSPQLLQRFLF